MKKIVLVLICLLLVVGCGKKKEDISKITLEINPRIEISVKEDKVEDIKALNEDAEKVLDKELKGLDLEEALDWIINRSLDLGFIKGDKATVLVQIDGKYEQHKFEELLYKPLGKVNVSLEMIVIDKVTKEDEELAKEKNISVAKAHLINELVKERNVNAEDYVNKSISEIKETKETGFYCEKGYDLRGNQCYKEIAQEPAQKGKVCPRDYVEYKGKCYKEARADAHDDASCPGEMKDGKCYATRTENAIPAVYKCQTGELKRKAELGLTDPKAGDANDLVCIDMSKVTHPVSPCEAHDGTEHMMSGGKCYWHRAPVIATGCPGKIKVNGECWDDATGIYICEGINNGITYKDRNSICPGTAKYTSPNVVEYQCPKDYTLKDNKCLKYEEMEQIHNVTYTCPSGMNLVEHDKCIDEKDTKDFEDGYVCSKEKSEIRGDTCYIFEVKEASKQ